MLFQVESILHLFIPNAPPLLTPDTTHLLHSSWLSDMNAVLMTDDLPQDVSGAEEALSTYLEHKVEIDARQDSFSNFLKQGEALVQAGHYASQEVSPSSVITTSLLYTNYLLHSFDISRCQMFTFPLSFIFLYR